MAVPAAVMAGVQLASTALGTISSIQQAKAQRAALRAAQEYNRKMGQALAKAERQRAEVQTRQMSNAAVQDLGALRAGMGQNGFELDSGSNYSLLVNSAKEHQFDILQMRNNAEQRAWEHIANSNRPSGSAEGGGLQTAATILGGLNQGFNAWDKYQKVKGK